CHRRSPRFSCRSAPHLLSAAGNRSGEALLPGFAAGVPGGRARQGHHGVGARMILDPAKVKLAKTIATDKVGYWCAAVDAAAKRLFIGATDFSIHVHDLPAVTPSKLGPLKGHGSYVTALAYLPASQTLVSGSFDKELLWWKPGEVAGPTRRVKAGARIN